ncbi:hypothetical protein NBRC110019_24960 [Neptunitalea chrysea]|uniref:Uncharacterized protein n=1 Tax=Neptunitalea chrysea TaxID=1647581 RepID=A0A9W6B6H3_9FLAO|nr:hypothetical protein NBRC110019_24960 [Neptunitalea chrysea]
MVLIFIENSKIIKDELIENKYTMPIKEAEPYIKALVAEKSMFSLIKESTDKGTYFSYFILGYNEYTIKIGV